MDEAEFEAAIQAHKDTAGGYTRVRTRCVNDEYVCATCRASHDRIYTYDTVPILPAQCTSESGCRCYVQPVVDIDDFAAELDRIGSEDELETGRRSWWRKLLGS